MFTGSVVTLIFCLLIAILATGIAILIIVSLLLFHLKNEKSVMATLTDLKTKMQALIDEAAGIKSTADSALLVLNNQQTQLASLKQQLADAIASGDPAALQAVADEMDATLTALDASKTELATAIANVPTDGSAQG